MKIYLVLFLLCFFWCATSQTVSGVLKDTGDKPIPFASVLFKESSNPSAIVEYTNAREGFFKIELKAEYTELLIEVNTSDYETESYVIKAPQKGASYNVNFTLQKVNIQELDEIQISAERRPLIYKKDTLTYNIDKYKEPTDRKVQDVLKRLPGIEVNEKSGEIKYQGKSVETVTLDGDNLFGYNYSLGTKNINVDMLEQVEAIENYSENPLLKGLQGNEKVSLNLKLKKGKTDYSGNIDSGAGINNNYKLLNNSNANILGVSKGFKSFGVLSFNNLGINHTPFDYFSDNKNVEQIQEKDFYTQRVIQESLFNSIIDDERANRNNLIFGNYNALFKLSTRLSIKANLYYLKDNLKIDQTSFNENSFENTRFTTSDEYRTSKNPTYYRGDVELRYNISKKSLLEYKTRFFYEEITSSTNILQNYTDHFDSKVFSKNIFANQNLIYTSKLNETNALQLQIAHSYNYIPQDYTLKNMSLNLSDEQNSNFKKNRVNGLLNLLGANSKSKYSLSVGANYEESPYTSFNSILTPNEVIYIRKILFTSGSINYTYSNWTITPSYSLKYLYQKIDDTYSRENSTSKNFTIIEPSLLMRYKFSNTSFISSKASFTQAPFSEEYIFSRPVIISNRVKVYNTPTLEIQKSQSYSISYYSNDMYNQFYLLVGINYLKSNSGFFTNIEIDQNETILNNFYLKEPNDNLNLNVTTEKFLNFLSSNLKLTSSVSRSSYNNIVNNSELRDNKSLIVTNTLAVRTAFLSKFNFDNEVTLNHLLNKSNDSNSIENNSLVNSLHLKFKQSKNLFLVVSGDYYLPSFKNATNDYLFLDLSLVYKAENKKFEYNLIAKNILNEEKFSQIQTSDFSKNTLRTSLISRYVYLNISYKF